jgi:long-chain acyl-CoA synthetase
MTSGLWRGFSAVVRRQGSAIAIIQGDNHVSFSELHEMSSQMASAFLKTGMVPGDRCLVWSSNSPRMAAAILGIWMLGGIVALVNDEAPLSHLLHAAAVTQPRIAMVESPRVDIARSNLACPVLDLGDDFYGTVHAQCGALVHELEPASIFFTSGSTGLPKGVTQNHATLQNGCRMVAGHLRLVETDRILCPIPWAFDYGYGQLLSTLLLGMTQILPSARNPFALCDAIERHKPTIFAGLPSIYALLLKGLSPIRETDLSSLRLLTNTGGSIPPAIFAEVRSIFSLCKISLNYGMTETYRSSGLPVDLVDQEPGSVGYAYPGVMINILRENGEEAEPGEVGEIIHRGTGTFMGYWGAPEATAAVLRPDPLWKYQGIDAPRVVFSGDLGWKTPDGLLMVKGRRDRQIKSMGVRVSPDEVEGLIRASGLVQDVAIVGISHEIMGEMVVAAIIPSKAMPEPILALKAMARQKMSQHMQPREYHMMDSYPLTPNGKTDFIQLRADLSKANELTRRVKV